MNVKRTCSGVLFVSIVSIGIGCSAKDINPPKVKLVGDFTRSVEVYQIKTNNATYYVDDPRNLLMKHITGINNNDYYKNFKVCVIGTVSADGSFGHLGRYNKQFTVEKLC